MFYCNQDLDTISEIPDCINKIHYIYNFANKKTCNIEQIFVSTSKR